MKRVENPPNPFTSHDCQYLEGMAPPAKLEVYEDRTRNILAENDSPDLGFRYSLNPYRGCMHACAYCYARPSHEYLDFGAGTDFETKIVIKPKAPELLCERFASCGWKGEFILFSGDTDCYQPLEANYQLTKRCLEVCLEFGNPLGIVTKSALIRRDIDLLRALDERTYLRVTVSIPFIDEKIARLIEPHAASIGTRFEVVQALADQGISVGVNIAPIIPGLNDADIPKILAKAKNSGAQSAGITLLRLPGNVKEVFTSRIKTLFPLSYKKILGRIREVRSGKLYNAQFGKRFEGEGPYWENIEKIFEVTCEKLGLNQPQIQKIRPPFKRPTAQKELELVS